MVSQVTVNFLMKGNKGLGTVTGGDGKFALHGAPSCQGLKEFWDMIQGYSEHYLGSGCHASFHVPQNEHN
jgi:hypothetical protein